MPRIAIIPGDGIGPEVVREAVGVLEIVTAGRPNAPRLTHWDLGAERYLRDGVTITDQEFRALSDEHDAILLGALGDPRVPGNEHARDILLGLRFRLDLFINYRPSRLLDPRLSPLRNPPQIDIDVFRENTEGVYVNMGGHFKRGTPDEVAVQEDVNTYKGVERIVRAAFEHALRRGGARVTMVDKANAMPAVGSLWRRVFAEVGAQYPDVERETLYVDMVALDLVRRPERYQVIVTSNLFGDILSDLTAALTGGLGLAPSANLNPGRHALFEPVHGSAPDIAGKGIANPLGAILTTGLMLEYLGLVAEARSVSEVVVDCVRRGPLTPDLGGSAGTREVGSWIREALAGRSARTQSSSTSADEMT
jgi:3-isopropylmalate dehydrogenase